MIFLQNSIDYMEWIKFVKELRTILIKKISKFYQHWPTSNSGCRGTQCNKERMQISFHDYRIRSTLSENNGF